MDITYYVDVAYYSIARYDSVTRQMTDDAREFHAPQTITPESLADDLAVLVWENFTDFVSEWEGHSTLDDLKLVSAEGKPDQRAPSKRPSSSSCGPIPGALNRRS